MLCLGPSLKSQADVLLFASQLFYAHAVRSGAAVASIPPPACSYGPRGESLPAAVVVSSYFFRKFDETFMNALMKWPNGVAWLASHRRATWMLRPAALQACGAGLAWVGGW